MPVSSQIQRLEGGEYIQAALASPRPWLLAKHLQSRLDREQNASQPSALPAGVERDLRPALPKIGRRALMLYVCRRSVDSLPLLFTTLALAHPN